MNLDFAFHKDEHTGLFDQTSFIKQVARATVWGRSAAIMLLDLNPLRDVNDTVGHDVGDRVLTAVGQRLRENVGGDQMLFRIATDEFAVLIPGVSSPRVAYQCALRCLDCFGAGFAIGGTSIQIDASIGIAVAPHHGTTAVALLTAADLALERAKRQKGCAIAFFEPHLRREVTSRRTIRAELRRAFEDAEFELLYQPQFSFVSRTIVGVEALLRWNHPTRGQLAPAHFIQTLDDMQESAELGRWVLDMAIAQAARWQELAVPLRVAVNLFASQFRSGDLVGHIETTLFHHQLRAHLLVVELAERMVIGHGDVVHRVVHDLHRLGIGIALDGYGTGYASLGILRSLPISHLKIAREFLRDLRPHGYDAVLVETIIQLARSCKIGVVADGVETAAQEKWLTMVGCNDGQGHLYGKPMSAERITRLVTELGQKPRIRARRSATSNGGSPYERSDIKTAHS